MTTELDRVEAKVRETLDDLAQYEPDQIAAKLKRAGMLWCGSPRDSACPVHHYLEARLRKAGLLEYVVGLFVYSSVVAVAAPTSDGRMGRREIRTPASVWDFIRRYDRDDYQQLERTG